MKRILLVSIATVLAISLNAQEKSTFTDSRDGKTYKTVKIGNQVWMAENLAYKPSNGNYWSYDNDSSYVAKYGYLYDWQTARNVCPTGWHLPSDTEWTQLNSFVRGNPDKLKAKSGWDSNGTDDYGFEALPGGYRYANGTFSDNGNYGNWWSSTENYSIIAWRRGIGSTIQRDGSNKQLGFSVRCLMD